MFNDALVLLQAVGGAAASSASLVLLQAVGGAAARVHAAL